MEHPIYIILRKKIKMNQQIKILQKVITRKGTSNALTFSTPHVLKSILLLSSQKYVSRSSFSKELKIGEGASKTLIKHLKESGLVETIKAGTNLTEKGKKVANQFFTAIPNQTHLKKCDTTRGKYNYAILIKKKFVQNLGNGMEQRDYAILYGASDSLTLIFEKKKFLFAGDKMQCFSKETDVKNYLMEKLNPEEGDVVIITSSDDKFVAEISAINTVLGTLTSK